MKKIYTLFFALIALSTLHAQCPQFLAFDTTICHSTVNRSIDATVLNSQLCGDSIQVIFNDSTTALNGSPQVYFHSGPEFTPFTGWQNQYTVDTGSSTAGKMTRIGTHLWSIKFNPRTYFNYSVDSCLNSIAFGFRDSNYANYVKCGSSDIYVVTASGTAVSTCASTFFTATYTHNTNTTYLWNDGNTNGIRTFTAGGHYTVTATGAGGCTATGSVNINLSNSQVSLGNDTIHCTTGYVVVATPGFASYLWGNGSTASTYIGFNPGRIWVQATDSFGCTSYDTTTVHYSQTWGLKLGDTLISCPGNNVSADASININLAGDSLVIVYDATKGQTQLIGDTNVYMHSGPEFRPFEGWQGQYTVGNYGQNDGVGRMTSLGNNKWRIAIDPQAYYGYLPDSNLNGVFMIFRNFDGTKTGKDSLGNNIYVYTNGVFPFHNAGAYPSCSFDGVTPSLTARQPLTYTWSNGVHTAADTFTTSGVYTVTVSDGICSRTDSVRAVFSSSIVVSIGADTTVCTGQHVVMTAPAGYGHYLWSDGDTTISTNVSAAGIYTVSVTTASGCVGYGARRVANSIHQVSLGADITRCSTTATTLAATAGFVSYSWIGTPSTSVNTYAAVNAGSYWVAATDSFGCLSYDTVRVINSPVINLSVVDSITSCPGTSQTVDASTSITQNGDSLIIIYDATKHGNADSLVGASKVYMHSGPEFYPFQGWVGAYTVGHFGVDDGIGEMDSIAPNKWRIAIIPQSYYGFSPDTPLNGVWMIFRNADGTHTGKDYNNANIFVYTAVTPPTCSFDGVTPSRNATSGTTYSWSTPTGTVSGPVVSANTTGLYIVTATNGICSKSDTIHANFSSNTTLNLGANSTLCYGDSLTISAGSGYTHYTWSNGDTTSSILVRTAATYSVTATNGTGCSSTGQRTISVSHPVLSLGADILKCDTSAAILTAPAGFASYQWIQRAPSSNTFAATKTGTYWVVATDSFGCTVSDTVSVRYSEVLQLSLPDTLTSCPGNLVQLNANTNIAINGDSIVIFYDATQGQTGLVGASKVYMHSGPEFHPFQGWVTQYTVGNWGQDDGVGRMDSLGNNRWSITIFPQSYYRYSPDTPLNGIWMVFRNADGTQTGKDNTGNNIFLNLSTLSPTSSFSGVSAIHKDAGTISYLWSNNATAGSIAVGASGRYRVTVTDGTCSNTDSTYVNLNNNLAINIGNDTSICPSGSVTFNAGAGFVSYHWSNGDSTQSITVSAAGTYTVSVVAGSGCIAADSATVRINGAKVNAGADMIRCSKTDTLTLSASVGYVQYQWFGTGTSSRTYRAVSDGCYWVEATDSAGCTSYDTVCVSTSAVEGLHAHDTLSTCIGAGASFDASVNVNAAGDSLVIIFDATQNTNSAPLLGSHKVYMHSGPEFHPFQGWQNQYTVGNWGQDDGVGEMDSIAPNKWRIAIIPSGYYHFNPDTPLNSIFMVFRNANGTVQNAGGNIDLLLVGAGTPSSTYAGVTASYRGDNSITYTWSGGIVSGSVDSFTSPGTYYVTATEGSCSKVDTITVNQFANPAISLKDTCLTSGRVVLNAGTGFASYVWNIGASTDSIVVTHAGSYWVRVANAAGCMAADTVTVDSSCGPPVITGCTPPVAYFRVLSISPGGVATFKDSSSYGKYYSWTFGDGTSLLDSASGATVHGYGASGSYTVTEIVSDSCGLKDTMTIHITVLITGINEINGFSAVSLYPNPASNYCTISISASQTQETDVEVTNILGQLVSTQKWQVNEGSDKLNLDVSGIASGMYTVTIRAASGVITRKLDIIK